MANKVIYAKYIGDEFITVGTAKELSKELNIKEVVVQRYATPTHKRKTSHIPYEERVIFVKIGEEPVLYGFYDNDKLVYTGTIREIATQMGVQRDAMYYYLNKIRNGRVLKKL